MSLNINRNTLERCGQNVSSLQSNIQKYSYISPVLAYILCVFLLGTDFLSQCKGLLPFFQESFGGSEGL